MLLRFTQYSANVLIPLDRLQAIIEFRPEDSKTPIRTHICIAGDTYAGVDQDWKTVLAGRKLAREIERSGVSMEDEDYLDCSSTQALKAAAERFHAFAAKFG